MIRKSEKVVSVIIPVYEGEKYIRRCVKSLIDQTYKNLEIILVDDGSQDRSLEICNEISKEDNRIKVYHHGNKGVSVTRNVGLDQATGDYVLFLDVDDWIEKTMIINMVRKMEECDASIGICGFYYADDNKTRECLANDSKGVEVNEFFEQYFWELYENTVIFNIGTKIYKRDVIEKYNLRFHTDMVIYEDIIFSLEYFEKIKKIYMVSDAFYYYYQGNISSATHTYKEKFWSSTSAYCDYMLWRFKADEKKLIRAIVECIFRAFLQECTKPKVRKSEMDIMFDEMNKYILRLEIADNNEINLPSEQRIFARLVQKRKYTILWIIVLGIRIIKKCKI